MAEHVSARWNWRIAMWGGAAALLAAAAVLQALGAMNWGPGDFLLAATLLLAVCAGVEAAMRLSERPLWRALAAAGIVGAFLLVWAELAVGIFH